MVEGKNGLLANKQSKKKSGAEQKAEKVASMMKQTGKGSILSDVGGSYTGTPQDDLYPVQDADDL
ncbi:MULTISPECIES: hypothetical protein [Eubacteriales]|uniref:hypothetical protein n=1 Tax=Eubacteriales TaxID=186802 RepID=UPI0006818BB1|nr:MULTISPECIES: hypothetical protein [Eubacteriales]